jgi:hypothetical protein
MQQFTNTNNSRSKGAAMELAYQHSILVTQKLNSKIFSKSVVL